MTSPQTGVWLRSEENAWIVRVARAGGVCMFFGRDPGGKLFEAWKATVRNPSTATIESIAGRRNLL
jgi:hypothetical protein